MQCSELTAEFLNEQYTVLKKDINQIGKEFGLDGRNVWRYLKKFEIPRRVRGGGAKKRIDLLGRKFGKLLVVEKKFSESGFISWICKCDCGNHIETRTTNLLSKKKSCGCSWLKAQAERQWNGHEEISGEYWGAIKKGAKVRFLDFKMTIEEAWELFEKQNRKCALSGVDIKFSRNRKIGIEQTASLDRIDSSVGYKIDNVQWVHKDINRMKQNFNNEYFVEMCKLITERNKERNCE
jgi:hypothetical protein